MITEDYVSFETAKLLKEKGFHEECKCQYGRHGSISWTSCNNGSVITFARPTLQMACKWLRLIYHIHIRLINSSDESYRYEIYPRKGKYNSCCFSDKSYYETYEQACEVAIKYCLENLI